jgi:hypothetical protein
VSEWISVVGWDDFQHYKDRNPLWIKVYTRLLGDDAYLDLSEHRALMLHRLWLEYARTGCALRVDTARLSRRLSVKVTRSDLDSLNHAGFIDIVASKALAEGYQPASPRASRGETETEEARDLHQEGLSSSNGSTTSKTQAAAQEAAQPAQWRCDFSYDLGEGQVAECGVEFKDEASLLEHKLNVHGLVPA